MYQEPMTKTNLLPCPFCGGDAYVNDDPTGNGGKPHMGGNVDLGRLWSVECDECGADGGFHQDKGITIKAWNTRAERTCQQLDVTEKYKPYVTYMTECSLCGEKLAVEEYPAPNYCPNCGAKVVDK